MRNCRVPIGWPRRDPRHYRFSLPNTVWNYQLKPIEFVVLSYLCYCRSHSNNHEPTSTESVARAVHITIDTAKKYLSALVNSGLVTSEHSLAPDFRCADGQKFFTMPNETFLLDLPPSAFMVYAYLLLIEDRGTHTCHPSYNTIAAETGMSKNTVIKNINVLLDMGLITIEHTRYFDQHGMKWKGNNLYTILPTQWVVNAFHQRQLNQLELDTKRRRFHERQAALCASPGPDP